jgi:antitoxin component of RelBE/YafQ-DinJ toxin-antitoxin module
MKSIGPSEGEGGRKMGKDKELTPEFKTEAQEAEYWGNHSPLDLVAEPNAQKVRVRGAKDRPITIRLDSESRSKLEKLAAEQGLGPSTLARLILTSVIESKEKLPRKVNLDELRDMLEKNMPQPLKDRAESLARDASIGSPDNPAFLIDNSQVSAWEEFGLETISTLLAMYNVQIINREHKKYKAVKTLVLSGT